MGAERKQIKEFTNETELNFGQGNKRFNLFSRLDDFVTYLRTKITGGAALPYRSTVMLVKLGNAIDTESTILVDELELNMTWSKPGSDGIFQGTFDLNKIDINLATIFIGGNWFFNLGGKGIYAFFIEDGNLSLQVWENEASLNTDEVIPIEIRQYS